MTGGELVTFALDRAGAFDAAKNRPRRVLQRVDQPLAGVESVNARVDLAGDGELLADADDLAAVLAVGVGDLPVSGDEVTRIMKLLENMPPAIADTLRPVLAGN